MRTPYPRPCLFFRFLPEKKKEILNSYIYHPFGIGPRSCMGKRFAIAEVKMAAVKLLLRYKWSVSTKTKVHVESLRGPFCVPSNVQRSHTNTCSPLLLIHYSNICMNDAKSQLNTIKISISHV
jgi:hypothetical protein